MIIALLLTLLSYRAEPPTCQEIIERIAMHEAGNASDTMIEFVAETALDDVRMRGLRCQRLTAWRWRIGSVKFVNERTQRIVAEVFARYPDRRHPQCQFVGMPRDLPYWRKYGAVEGYRLISKSFIVVGAGCRD